jgi:hypothetical protein
VVEALAGEKNGEILGQKLNTALNFVKDDQDN